jgi:hypothetical protein
MCAPSYTKTQGQPAPDKNWAVEFHEEFFEEFGT